MIDPADAENVIDSVAGNLVHRIWWLDEDPDKRRREIANDARVLCDDRGFDVRATTTGALYHFLRVDLVRKYETERQRAPISLADVDSEGTVYGYGDDEELVACGYVSGQVHGRHTRQGAGRVTSSTAGRGTDDSETVDGRESAASTGLAEDKRPRHVVGGRSHLLDRFRTMNGHDFLAWASGTLSDDSRWSAKAKTGHLEVILRGSSREKADLWKRYVNAKRIGGTTNSEDREARLEDWHARYRWNVGHHPLVMSADGETITVATTLREPIR